MAQIAYTIVTLTGYNLYRYIMKLCNESIDFIEV